MRPVIAIFVAATLFVAAGVYLLIAATTPLSPAQAIGSGVAFLFGWGGFAYAGSAALRAMLRRRRARLASSERAEDRAAAIVRRYNQSGPIVEPALARLPRKDESVEDG